VVLPYAIALSGAHSFASAVADHIKREKENDLLGLKLCSQPSKAVDETPQLSAKANPVMVEEEPMNYIAERIKSVFGEVTIARLLLLLTCLASVTDLMCFVRHTTLLNNTQEFYDRSFEQWCDNKHHGKAYSTVSGPRRDNYDWVPGPDLASIAVRLTSLTGLCAFATEH
jgi:hypothetical protein